VRAYDNFGPWWRDFDDPTVLPSPFAAVPYFENHEEYSLYRERICKLMLIFIPSIAQEIRN